MSDNARLKFEVTDDTLLRVVRKCRLSGNESDFHILLDRTGLALAASQGDVNSRGDVPVTSVEGLEPSVSLHWQVSSELFTRLLCSRLTREHKACTIQFAFLKRELVCETCLTATATITLENMRLKWPFRRATRAIAPNPTTEEKAGAAPVDARILGACLDLARPYADQAHHRVYNNIDLSGGLVRSGQATAARWIDATELAGVNFALSRDAAGPLGHALRHFSSQAKIVIEGNEIMIFDDDAALRCTTMPSVDRLPRPENVPVDAILATSDFKSSFAQIVSQRRPSEKYFALHFDSQLPAGGLRLSTPVIGGDAVSSCDLKTPEHLTSNPEPKVVQEQLLVDHVGPVGIDQSGSLAVHFLEGGVLFTERKSTLSVSTLVARKREERPREDKTSLYTQHRRGRPRSFAASLKTRGTSDAFGSAAANSGKSSRRHHAYSSQLKRTDLVRRGCTE